MNSRRSPRSGEKVQLRIEVSRAIYRAWIRAKAELDARTNEECLKKLLEKCGFYNELEEFLS